MMEATATKKNKRNENDGQRRQWTATLIGLFVSLCVNR